LRSGAEVKDIVVVIKRGDGADRLKAKGYNVKTMVEVEVDEKHVSRVTESANGIVQGTG
jgi:adenine phosphoribosyltransferase